MRDDLDASHRGKEEQDKQAALLLCVLLEIR